MDEQPKLRRLKKLVASEVSLVNRGAVRRPFLIVKNKDGTVPTSPQRDLFAITPEQNARIDAVIRKAGNFDESKHPRADNGEFGSGGGGGGGKKDKKGKSEEASASAAEASSDAKSFKTRASHLAAARAHDRAERAATMAGRPDAAAHHETQAAKHRINANNVSKADAKPVRKDDAAMGAAPDATTDDDMGDDTDDGMPDERSMAALKAVYRILLPFKGQITEDMVDDVLAELDLDDTGEDGQDADNDGIDDSVDADVDLDTEEDTVMAKGDGMPDELKDKLEKGASWTPAQPEGMSDDDYNKAVAAAKAAFSGACSKDAGDDEDDDKDDDVKKNVQKAALPQQAELVAKAEAEKKQWIAKAAELEARLGKMEDERVLKSHEDDIRRDCQVLGKDPAAQAVILKSAFAASAEAGKAYRELLAESASISREGVFKSVGTSSNASFGAYVPSDGQGTARSQLEAMVKGLVQKGESKDEAAAWATVLNTKRGQELYAADRTGGH